MRILISPFSQYLRNEKRNPKNYPHWPKLIKLLQEQGHIITQIGLFNEGAIVQDFRADLTNKDIKKLFKEIDLFICVDTFLPHLAHLLGKKGIVIFGPSDPKIFGYSENINIYKDKKYFREKQFDFWENCEYNPEAFVEPEVIVEAVNKFKEK